MKPAKVWRAQPQRYRLEASKCTGCGEIAFPPRLVCPSCHQRAFETCTLPDTGKVVTYTVLHVGSEQFSDEMPFAIGIIELDNGVRLMAQIVDFPPDMLATGARVSLAFRKIREDGEQGVIAYAHKAVPA